MNPIDMTPAGEKAKGQLRIAQALAELSQLDRPPLNRVVQALCRVSKRNPEVAAGIIMDYALKRPLHEQSNWCSEASEMINAYCLQEHHDGDLAAQAREFINARSELSKQEARRLERIRDRISYSFLSLLLFSIIGLIVYAFYAVATNKGGREAPRAAQEAEKPKKDSDQNAENDADKKPAPKTARK